MSSLEQKKKNVSFESMKYKDYDLSSLHLPCKTDRYVSLYWLWPAKNTVFKYVYLIGPSVLIPGRELQHSDDFVDLGAHLLEGEVAVLQRLLHPMAARRLGGHKDFDT